jgi:DHA2 family metal-tetracycline-proton antiporter-like MFS transporter
MATARTAEPENERGGYSTRLLLLILISAVFVAVLNTSMVNVVVPVIGEEFGASEAQVGWVITGYLLVYAVGIPLYGRVSDLFSLRTTFTLGLLTFAVGSLACALAPNLLFLVFGRVVQAAGGASIPALSAASVTRLLPSGDRGAALGLIVSSVGIGAAVGPVVGGFVDSFVGWQALFYGTLLLTLFLIVGAWFVLPHTTPTGEHWFDLPGGILLGLAAGLFLFGITQGQVAGFGSPSSWGSFVGAALAAVGFAWRIARAAHPFASPKLFKNRAFMAAVLIGFFTMLANVSSLVSVPLLISQVNGLPSGATGLVLAPGAVAVALFSPISGRLSDRVGARIPISIGLAIMLLSVLFLSTLGAGSPPLVVATGMLGVGTGFAFVNSPTTNAAAAALNPQEVGVGLGIQQGIFFLGGGTGPAVVGAFLAARREGATQALNPFYTLDAAPFSDAFLLLSLALLLAFGAFFGLSKGHKEKGGG